MISHDTARPKQGLRLTAIMAAFYQNWGRIQASTGHRKRKGEEGD